MKVAQWQHGEVACGLKESWIRIHRRISTRMTMTMGLTPLWRTVRHLGTKSMLPTTTNTCTHNTTTTTKTLYSSTTLHPNHSHTLTHTPTFLPTLTCIR